MLKAFLALGAAGVAMTAVPAEARHAKTLVCNRAGHCVKAHKVKARHVRAYRVGHRFGPRYSYTSYSALPRTYRVRYHLAPRYRYVYSNGYIYQVDPATYAITRILNAF